MTCYVNQIEFARMCALGDVQISRAMNYAFPDAVENKKIDITHPTAIKFLQAGAPSATAWRDLLQSEGVVVRIDHPDQLDEHWNTNDVPDDISILIDKSMRFIISKFGSAANYSSWLKTVRDKELIKEKQLKNALASGVLIKREYVRIHMFGSIAETLMRLLTDSPRTIASRSKEIIEAGGDLEEVERLIESIMSGHINALQVKLKKAMEHAK